MCRLLVKISKYFNLATVLLEHSDIGQKLERPGRSNRRAEVWVTVIYKERIHLNFLF